MDWNTPIDIYCERLGPGLWAEPLNLITNVFFLLAAVLAYRRERSLQAKPRREVTVLCLLLFLVGIGSGLFHSFATLWAQRCDEVPIALFVLTFFCCWCYQHTFPGSKAIRLLSATFAGFCLLVVTIAAAVVFSDLPLNGSQAYLGPLSGLLFVAVNDYRKHNSTKLFTVAGLFAFSIFLRSIDMLICPILPIGTHFLWHTANAAVTYLVLIRYAESTT